MKLSSKLSLTALLLGLGGLAQAANNDTFINCTSRAPSGFSPALVMDGISYNASSQQVYNRLVEFTRGSTDLEPGLAESWDISDDGLEYTFHLRKGSNSILTRSLHRAVILMPMTLFFHSNAS